MSWRRILILSLFDLRHSIFKMKGLFFLVPFGIFWAITFYELEKGGIELVLSQQGLALSTLLLNPEISELLLVNNPAVISICYYLGLSMIPFMTMLAANNQLASDAGYGSLRYLLTRCSRTELFLSRFLACVYLVSIAFVFVLGYACYVSLEIDQFTLMDTLLYGLKVATILVLYSLPIIAFMSIFSAFFSSTLGSLLWGAVCFFLLIIIRYWYTKDLSQLEYILPNIFKTDLLMINNPALANILLYLIIYTFIYGCVGWLIFKQRNL